MEQLFLQFGVSGATLGAMVIIVKAFLKANETISKDFNETIKNHIVHSSRVIEGNTKATDRLYEILSKKK